MGRKRQKRLLVRNIDKTMSFKEIQFELDPLLEKDSIFIMELPLSKLVLMNDANFLWFLLIPRREGVHEVFELCEEDLLQLNKESNYLLKELKTFYKGKKMNVANLGNIVPQLHIHHIVRYEDDLAWPGPIWGIQDAKPYKELERSLIVEEVRELMKKEFGGKYV